MRALLAGGVGYFPLGDPVMVETPPIQFFTGPDGRKIAYTVHGRGPLVICPAWWISHLEEDWKHPPFRSFFKRLGQDNTVIRYDRPGAGMSDRVPGEVSLAAEVAILEALFDQLGANSASLFAVSCAGPPALALAATRPHRVERLVLYGSFCNGAQVATLAVQAAMRTLVEAHWGFGSEALANIFHPGLPGQLLDDFGRRQRRSADAATASRVLQLTYEMDATEVLKQVSAPTLAIHRREDRAIPLEAGRQLAAGVPGASLVILEGTIHPPWEGPDDVLNTVTDFLAEGSSKTVRQKVGLPGASADGEGSMAASCRFDPANRELMIEGRRQRLTPLEHRLLCYLQSHAERVVTRDEALVDVWEQPFGGSNVVDAVVRTLRRKLGPCASVIETVKGHGYRYRSGVLEE